MKRHPEDLTLPYVETRRAIELGPAGTEAGTSGPVANDVEGSPAGSEAAARSVSREEDAARPVGTYSVWTVVEELGSRRFG